MRVTDKKFFEQDADKLAPQLLGMYLCRNVDGKTIKLKITETEAYCGEADTACHAHKGKTERTKILYETGGKAYVYLCYGIHSLLNVVCGANGSPHAVLIRGVEGFPGPGKLTKALKIDRSLNGENLLISEKLWIENIDGRGCEYVTSKRIGIDYASDEYKNKLWRFTLKA